MYVCGFQMLFSTHAVPPVLQHTDGSTGIRTVLGRDMATQLMLSAKILRANPPVTSDQVSWRKNNTSIMDNPDYITTVTPTRANLTIITLNMDNTALYTVTVMHEAGNASLQFWLIVFGKCVCVCVCVFSASSILRLAFSPYSPPPTPFCVYNNEAGRTYKRAYNIHVHSCYLAIYT